MSDTLLSATVMAVAQRIGDQLPAAYGTEPTPMQLAGDAADHALPEDAVVVRWTLGDDGGHLMVAVTSDAADMLAAGPPERTVTEALTECVEAVAIDLAGIFGGIPPMLGEGVQVEAGAALAGDSGDPVSVRLNDGEIHRATVGLRLVITDDLLGPPSNAQVYDLPEADPFQSEELSLADQQSPGGSQELAGAGVGAAATGPVALGSQQGGSLEAPAGPGIVGGGGRRQASGPQRGPLEAPVGEAHPADFSSFDQLHALPGKHHPMSLLGDVEMGVTAELGRTELTVRDVLGLTPGSIIELDRAAGSPVDVVVNGTLIARGEVVVIDEEFGIRITEILGMADEANPFPIAQ